MSTVINFIGGAGIGKSTMAALTFARLKMRHEKAEYVQEYAKNLVWQNRFEELNDQHHVSSEQYKMIKAMDGKVDYIVCDSPLLIGLFYNRVYPNNMSNIKKTETMILNHMSEFKNIYICLIRSDDRPYEPEGRVHTEDEARQIDRDMIDLLKELKLEYITVLCSEESIPLIIKYTLASKQCKFT
jgi:hypothetical protein